MYIIILEAPAASIYQERKEQRQYEQRIQCHKFELCGIAEALAVKPVWPYNTVHGLAMLSSKYLIPEVR